MQLSARQKKALFWGMGILLAMVLVSVAWAQINASLSHCFSGF
jgi:hypothetical protein